MAARFVGHGYSALNAPAKAEGFCQAHGEPAPLQGVAGLTQLGNQITLVGLLEVACHLIPQAKTAAVVSLRVVQRALEGTGIHNSRYLECQLYGASAGPRCSTLASPCQLTSVAEKL